MTAPGICQTSCIAVILAVEVHNRDRDGMKKEIHNVQEKRI